MLIRFTLSLAIGAALFAADRAGSRDHPLLTRYAGAEIIGYFEKTYEAYTLPLGRQRECFLKFSKIYRALPGSIAQLRMGGSVWNRIMQQSWLPKSTVLWFKMLQTFKFRNSVIGLRYNKLNQIRP